MKPTLLALLVTPLLLTQCIVVEENGGSATPQATGNGTPSYGQPLTATRSSGQVTIMEGSRKVATCSTSSPNVEETRFINEQDQIVVKSRGNHGPATVQLFNTHTGAQEASVMAYDIRNGRPAWAAGMGE